MLIFWITLEKYPSYDRLEKSVYGYVNKIIIWNFFTEFKFAQSTSSSLTWRNIKIETNLIDHILGLDSNSTLEEFL